MRWLPGVGPVADRGDGLAPARLVHQPPAVLGRADPRPRLRRPCETQLLTAETVRHFRDLFRREGADAWFTQPVEEIAAARTRPARSAAGPPSARKGTSSTSGSSRAPATARCSTSRASAWAFPAFMYLEGSDQHRGWFQSSILTAVGTTGTAPFETVLTHGFVVDDKGKKMAKSGGNAVSAVKATEQYGADVLRLYVASMDYADDVRISERGDQGDVRGLPQDPQHLPLPPGQPRRLRHVRPVDRRPATLHEIDRWALGQLNAVIRDVTAAYERFEFYRVYQRIYQFCAVDLSSFYLDVLKDRLYAEAPDGPDRRAAQFVLARLHDALTRLLAPIIPHTAEELWDFLPADAGQAGERPPGRLPRARPALGRPRARRPLGRRCSKPATRSSEPGSAPQGQDDRQRQEASVRSAAEDADLPPSAGRPRPPDARSASSRSWTSGASTRRRRRGSTRFQVHGRTVDPRQVRAVLEPPLRRVGPNAAHPTLCERCAAGGYRPNRAVRTGEGHHGRRARTPRSQPADPAGRLRLGGRHVAPEPARPDRRRHARRRGRAGRRQPAEHRRDRRRPRRRGFRSPSRTVEAKPSADSPRRSSTRSGRARPTSSSSPASSPWSTIPADYQGRVINIHPALIPSFCGKGFYGAGRPPGGARLRREGQRLHRPLRRRHLRHRPDHPPAHRAGPRRRHPGRSPPASSRPSARRSPRPSPSSPPAASRSEGRRVRVLDPV